MADWVQANPPEISDEELKKEAEEYLQRTDWMILRYLMDGTEIEDRVKNKREQCKSILSREALRNDMDVFFYNEDDLKKAFSNSVAYFGKSSDADQYEYAVIDGEFMMREKEESDEE